MKSQSRRDSQRTLFSGGPRVNRVSRANFFSTQSFSMYSNKKSLARNTRPAKPGPFSRRVAAAAAREGVLTYGVSPITVAGPWPILTAFPHIPNLQIVATKSMLRDG